MNVLSTCKFLAATASVVLPASSIFAAAAASDNAGNYAAVTFYDTYNFGSGFGPNVVTTTQGGTTTNGTFLGTSTTNNGGASGGIDSGNGKSFGLYANGGGESLLTRSFTAGGQSNTALLDVGQSFSLKLDNGYINTGSSVGFNLQNASGTTRLNFQFTGGNAVYTYNNGTTTSNTALTYTGDGLTVAFTEGAANTFTLTVTPNTGAPTVYTGSLAASDISQFQVYNNNAGSGGNYDAFFNNPTVSASVTAVPEPLTGAATMIVAAASALGIIRRRRKN